MYIVAIGWAYVILMMAITASSIGKGLAILVFLGILPLMLFTYVVGGPRRRQRSAALADQDTGDGNGRDAQAD
ncbi:hypothetical protein [Thiobacillus sedimenti]|uniref:Transmembrane protein n=1 Tax=Thiobacillus sedimenti TaxID=3110231 RepID=A0ABZ1CH32_9PROT|nr:hypothetical protein [Thiobacillus sp. SCUT-2]WRS38305.1 hypothetical protein VA613_09805 [Thiobacillus sp. SCUT-2]